jgi:DNA-binding FadR family transcriptional regulator
VVRQVVRRIVAGVLEPGAPLPIEPVLAEQFGVSRTVVREAVRVLVSMGLVEVKQGSGTRVRPSDAWDYLDPLVLFEQVRARKNDGLLDEVLEGRRILEVEATGLAAERRTNGDLDGLSSCLKGMRGALADPETFSELDVRFHDRILIASRNRLLREALRPVVDVLRTGRILTSRNAVRLEGGATRAQREHEEIYGAIEERDVGTAREAMRRHVEQFERDIRASLSTPDAQDIGAWSM